METFEERLKKYRITDADLRELLHAASKAVENNGPFKTNQVYSLIVDLFDDLRARTIERDALQDKYNKLAVAYVEAQLP